MATSISHGYFAIAGISNQQIDVFKTDLSKI